MLIDPNDDTRNLELLGPIPQHDFEADLRVVLEQQSVDVLRSIAAATGEGISVVRGLVLVESYARHTQQILLEVGAETPARRNGGPMDGLGGLGGMMRQFEGLFDRITQISTGIARPPLAPRARPVDIYTLQEGLRAAQAIDDEALADTYRARLGDLLREQLDDNTDNDGVPDAEGAEE